MESTTPLKDKPLELIANKDQEISRFDWVYLDDLKEAIRLNKNLKLEDQTE
jgi:hypothetical protein